MDCFEVLQFRGPECIKVGRARNRWSQLKGRDSSTGGMPIVRENSGSKVVALYSFHSATTSARIKALTPLRRTIIPVERPRLPTNRWAVLARFRA